MDQKSINPAGPTSVHFSQPSQASAPSAVAKDEFSRFEELSRKLVSSPKPKADEKSDD